MKLSELYREEAAEALNKSSNYHERGSATAGSYTKGLSDGLFTAASVASRYEAIISDILSFIYGRIDVAKEYGEIEQATALVMLQLEVEALLEEKEIEV